MTVGSRRRVAKAAQFARISAVAAPSPGSEPVVTHGVLLVEDDPDRQFRTARLLSSAGLRVVGASSGTGAMALLSTWSVDLVIVAEGLACGMAAAMARRIRATHGVPVVMLTAEPKPRRRKRDRLEGIAASVELRDVRDVHALLSLVLAPPTTAA